MFTVILFQLFLPLFEKVFNKWFFVFAILELGENKTERNDVTSSAEYIYVKKRKNNNITPLLNIKTLLWWSVTVIMNIFIAREICF